MPNALYPLVAQRGVAHDVTSFCVRVSASRASDTLGLPGKCKLLPGRWRHVAHLFVPPRPTRRPVIPKRNTAVCASQADPVMAVLARATTNKLKALWVACGWLWSIKQQWISKWYTKLLGCVALLLGVATVGLNVWGMAAINAALLPQACAAAAQVLGRQVEVGGVHWVTPTGVLGIHPLASVGPIAIGPGTHEYSSVKVSSCHLHMDPLQSLLQRQLVVRVSMRGGEVNMVQLPNFSWLGYPNDTVPTSRDVLPGLHQVVKSWEEKQSSTLVSDPARYGGKAQHDLSDVEGSREAVLPEAALISGGGDSDSSQHHKPTRDESADGSTSVAHADDRSSTDEATRMSSSASASTSAPHFPSDPTTPPLKSSRSKSKLGGDGSRGKTDTWSSSSPRYTPAATSPAAISASTTNRMKRIESTLGGRRRRPGPVSQLQAWLGYKVSEALRHAKAPTVKLDALSLHNAKLLVHMTGETIPRRISGVNATLRLGHKYGSMYLDVSGNAHERDPLSQKCSMPTSTSNNLRHVTGKRAMQRLADQGGDVVAVHPVSSGQPATPHTQPPQQRTDSTTHSSSMGSTDSWQLPTKSKVTVPRSASALESTLQSAYTGLAKNADDSGLAAPELSFGTRSDVFGGLGESSGDVEVEVLSGGGRKEGTDNPTGGRLRVRVSADNLGDPTRWPDCTIAVMGHNLHAPMVERILEVPVDVNEGRLTGDVYVHCYDEASWKFPEFGGRVKCKGLNIHFWNAPDDIIDGSGDLLLEGNRMYLHGAMGRFGAVPMIFTGDLDLNPETGQYRVSATLPGVELNALRATLGIRPTPYPLAGAVRGVLHVTGPLEKPIFSGTAVALAPTPEMLSDCEDSSALAALMAHPGAVGSYDRIPFSSGSFVFTLDSSSDMFTLHSATARPVGGGQLLGSGRMWVAPEAESHPNAVHVQVEGHRVNLEWLMKRYMPQDIRLPPTLVLGEGHVQGVMEGSHLAPTIHVKWEEHEAKAKGTMQFTRDAQTVTLKSPTLGVSALLKCQPPSFDAVKSAITQAQAIALAVPSVEGCEVHCNFQGLDVLPLLSNKPQVENLASGQPLRLKVTGGAHFSGRLNQPAADVALPAEGTRLGSTFEGDLSLDSLRVNQLNLTRKLTGSLEASDKGLRVHAKGLKADETLDVQLAWPLFDEKSTNRSDSNGATGDARRSSTPLQVDGGWNGDRVSSMGAEAAEKVVLENGGSGDMMEGGGYLKLRCGQLLISAEVNNSSSQVEVAVLNLNLDELELASLRGDLNEVSLSVNFETRLGRGKVHVTGPRFSGLQGESLLAAFRWDRDVIRLERTVLQQRNSRYEVQGDFLIPPHVAIPRSASSLVPGAVPRDIPFPSKTPLENLIGRWRLQVTIPGADMEEILPAARLLERATSVQPSDYQHAKEEFLVGVHNSGVAVQNLGEALYRDDLDLTEGPANVAGDDDETPHLERMASASPTSTSGTGAGTGGGRSGLPGLQDLRGHFSGSLQAFGSTGGATSVEFDLKGSNWQWGDYALEQAGANGSYHSAEGIKLEEFSLKAGDANMLLRGSLLGPNQKASLLINDFPVALLQPIFRAMPALEHAAPAAGGWQGSGVTGRPSTLFGSVLPFSGMVRKGPSLVPALTNMAGLREVDLSSVYANSPVNGLLYVRGTIGGTATAPTGELSVRLYDGAIGPTRLAQAQAHAAIDERQLLEVSMELSPAESNQQGHVKITGKIPLSKEPQPQPITSLGSGSHVWEAEEGTERQGEVAGESSSGEDKSMDVCVDIKDSGMMVVSTLLPDVHWQQGHADVTIRARGSIDNPQIEGAATVSKGVLHCPFLKYPVTNMGATVKLEENTLRVESLDARVGRKGFIRLKGALPLYNNKHKEDVFPSWLKGVGVKGAAADELKLDMHALELRVRNIFTGLFTGSVSMRDCLLQPVVGGNLRFSRGTFYVASPTVSSGERSSLEGGDSSLVVTKPFKVLTAGQGGRVQAFEQPVDLAMIENAQVANVKLQGLRVSLGPELRTVYPVVMNFGISGEVEVNGPADVNAVKLNGTINLDGGEVNLVATQLRLDREHQNKMIFVPEQGLDPTVDLSFLGPAIKMSVQGKASNWQNNLVLTYTTGSGGEGAEQLDPSEAARIFEGQLARALLEDDGQLAFSRLAASLSTLMPKLETQGQLGKARWRLVSAPSIPPGLLSLDPATEGTAKVLTSLLTGTEVEVQFGKSLQAAMVKKIRDSDIATQWTLNYQLNNNLRMQFNITGTPPYPRTLMFQYSGEGAPR